MVQLVEFTDFEKPLSREDTIQLHITSGSDPARVEVVLETAPKVTWWKGLELHGPDGRTIDHVETQDANHGPQSMSFTAEQLRGAKLVLAKAKQFGIHTGMYELRGLDTNLGQQLRFKWTTDVDSAGAVAGFFRDIGHGIDTAANAVADAVETVANAIGDAVSDAVETVGNFVADVLRAVGHSLGRIPIIGPVLESVFRWVANIVSAVFDLVGACLRAIFNIIGGVVGGVVRGVGGALGGLLAWDGDSALRSACKGLGDIGAGVSGAILLVAGKLGADLNAILFTQLNVRRLTEDEVNLLRQVYRGSVGYWNIRIVEGFAGFFSEVARDRPFVLGDTIYMKYTPPEKFKETLVHECCHVWQYQHSGSRYMVDALIGQDSGYDWPAAIASGCGRWCDLHPEGQAQFVQDAWREGAGPASTGDGAFFADDPIGTDVEFFSKGTSRTSFGVEAAAYFRSFITIRATRWL